jgi:GNAT superfamily N-acetyltransferase
MNWLDEIKLKAAHQGYTGEPDLPLEEPWLNPVDAAAGGFAGGWLGSLRKGLGMVPAVGRGLASGAVGAAADYPVGQVTDLVAEENPEIAFLTNLAAGLASGMTIERIPEHSLEMGLNLAKKYAGKSPQLQALYDTLANEMGKVTWHGTPHKYAPEPGYPHGRPRLDKMGTGEGAQAYGWGWYSADAKETGRNYANRDYDLYKKAIPQPVQKNTDFTVDGNRYTRTAGENDYKVNGNPIDAKAYFEAFEKVPVETDGNLYKFDIPDEVMPRLLDWDKPLSEQSAIKPLLEDAFAKAGFEQWQIDSMVKRDITGEQAYTYLSSSLGGKKQGSEMLKSIGIPGNRYLDGMSRGKGEGSYNYVIWDQDVLNNVVPLERNAERLESLDAIMREWRSKGVELDIYEDKHGLKLDNIVVPEDLRGQGIGKEVLEDIASYADKNNKTVRLNTASESYGKGTTSENRLKRFYRGSGFVENKGRNRDFAFRENMYRAPSDVLKSIAALTAAGTINWYNKDKAFEYLGLQEETDGI